MNPDEPQAPRPPQPQPAPRVPDWQQGLGQPPDAPPGGVALPPPVVPPSVPDAPPHMPAGQQPGPMASPQPAPTPSPAPPAMTPARPSRAPVAGMLALLFVALLVLGGAAFFIFGRTSKTAGLDSLQGVVFQAPKNVKGYTDNSSDTTIRLVSANETCELNAGTLTAGEAPGDTVDAMLKPQLDQLRESGATVSGPTDGGTLQLTAADNSKTYTMPTKELKFSQADSRAVIHFSGVILKNNERAVVSRICVSTSGEVDPAQVRALDDLAARITVSPREK